MIKSTQKVIKVGDSKAVLLPAKELARQNINIGDNVKVTVEAIDAVDPQKVELVELTQKLIKRHQKALDNLSQR